MKQDRRKFIETTASATAAMLLSSVSVIAETKPLQQKMNTNFGSALKTRDKVTGKRKNVQVVVRTRLLILR